MNSKSAVELLIELLEDETLEFVMRRSAACALGESRSDSAIEPLVRMLQPGEETEFYEEAVIEALGRIGSESAVGPLVSVLERDKDGGCYEPVIWALSEIGSESAAAELMKIAGNKEERHLRNGFLRAAAATGCWPLVRDLMTRLMGDEAAPIIAMAAENDPKSRGKPYVLKMLKHPEDANAPFEAVKALGGIRCESVMRWLIGLLEDKKNGAKLHSAAAIALGEMAFEAASEHLMKVLSDSQEDKEFCLRAIEVLGRTKTDAALVSLVKLLESRQDDADLRWGIPPPLTYTDLHQISTFTYTTGSPPARTMDVPDRQCSVRKRKHLGRKCSSERQ